MPRSNIVIIGTAHPLRGGLATYNERLAQAYSQRGDNVCIYTFSLQYPNFLFPGKTQFSDEQAPKDIDIKIKINSINPFNWIKIGREIKKRKPDLVIIRYWTPFISPCLGTICRIIRKNKHTKIIAIADNIIPHEKMIGINTLAKYIINSCDGFITMSKAVLNDLNKFDTKKPRKYTPHPLYDNFGDAISKQEAKRILNLDENTKYILFFGFIREYKGLDLLIKAFADKRFHNMPVKLLVVGEFYIDRKPYLELIEKEKLTEKVILNTKFIPNSEIVNYFCASDIIAQPYKDATQSGVTQIAYHFNKPMLTTNVGGLSELVPHDVVGYVVNPNSAEIADALFNFFDKNKEEVFSNNVKIEKKRFSWGILLQNIDKLTL